MSKLDAREVKAVLNTPLDTREAVLRAFLGQGKTNIQMEEEIYGIHGKRGFVPWAVYQFYGFSREHQGAFRDKPEELSKLIATLLESRYIENSHELSVDVALGNVNGPEDLAVRLQKLARITTTEVPTTQHVRVGQAALRQMLTATYGGCCALCEVRVPALLWASHIVPWSKEPSSRLDPSNAMLLCRQHDGLFEHGLISLGNDYQLLVSPKLRLDLSPALIPSVKSAAFRTPTRFPPDPRFLTLHRKRHSYSSS